MHFFLYHKCKVEYIELRVVKVVITRFIIEEKKVINIVLKNEISQKKYFFYKWFTYYETEGVNKNKCIICQPDD